MRTRRRQLWVLNHSPMTHTLTVRAVAPRRLAMLAITAYALEEFLTKAAVTVNTPFLFNSAL